jgi:hypothetical protein
MKGRGPMRKPKEGVVGEATKALHENAVFKTLVSLLTVRTYPLS